MDYGRSLLITLPELILSVGGLVLLLWSAWSGAKAMRGASIAAVALLVGAGFAALGFTGDAFGGLYSGDQFSDFAHVLIYIAAAISLMIAPKFFDRQGLARAEYPVLVIYACVGMGMMVSATDFLTLYIGLELNSLAAYVLASFLRTDERSAEAGLKYFVLGALASGILLFGMSLVYGFTGSTSFAAVFASLDGGMETGALFGIVFVLAGLAFKISAVPFHMWTPDVYEGAPTPVTAFFASAPKVAATALTVRVAVDAFGAQTLAWQQIIIFVALASIILGAVAAIGQTNLKRLLAYSSINNIGFMLIGLAAGTAEGVSAVLVYLTIYVAMTLGSFVCIMQLRGPDGSPREELKDIAGLSQTNKGLAFALAIFMFSLAGIPPLFGFWGKVVVFNAAIAAGLLPLAVIGIAASVIGAFYYIKIVKLMYFDDATGELARGDSRALAWTGAVLALLVSPVGYFAIPWLGTFASNASSALF